MPIYGQKAREVANSFHVEMSAGDRRYLMELIDNAISDVLDDAAAIVSATGQWGLAGEILKLRPPKHTI